MKRFYYFQRNCIIYINYIFLKIMKRKIVFISQYYLLITVLAAKLCLNGFNYFQRNRNIYINYILRVNKRNVFLSKLVKQSLIGGINCQK